MLFPNVQISCFVSTCNNPQMVTSGCTWLDAVTVAIGSSGLRFFRLRIYQITCVSFSPRRFFTLIETAATKLMHKLGGAGQMYPAHCPWNNSVPTSCFFELLPFVKLDTLDWIIRRSVRWTHKYKQIFSNHVITILGNPLCEKSCEENTQNVRPVQCTLSTVLGDDMNHKLPTWSVFCSFLSNCPFLIIGTPYHNLTGAV